MTTTRRPLVGVSLKMYFDPVMTLAYCTSLLPLADLASSLGIDVFVIPDFLAIAPVSNLISNGIGGSSSSRSNGTPASASSPSPLILGAQDCFWEASGPFTGEISPAHLSHYNVGLVELGHAERRRLLGETDVLVARKASAVSAAGLVPLVCIGEREDRGVASAVEECRPQVESLLRAIPEESDVVLAYEPVWAIGQPAPAGAEYVVAVTKELRKMAESFNGGKRTGLVRILYGGSAGPGLFEKLRDGVDGLFLGRFGHDVTNFEKVLREVAGGQQ